MNTTVAVTPSPCTPRRQHAHQLRVFVLTESDAVMLILNAGQHPAVPGGFTLDDFTIDEPAGAVTYPAGHTRPMSPKRTVTFGALCTGCPLRARCTSAADGRSMSIHPHEALLRAARA